MPGARRPLHIIVDCEGAGKPLSSTAAALTFADACLPDREVIQHVDEIRAGIAASRRRKPIEDILSRGSHGRHDHRQQKRQEIEDQIAALRERLRSLDEAEATRERPGVKHPGANLTPSGEGLHG